ncbi:hypothetical protein [Citrobacter sp.]|uniref:hypothetical protein n=1 Tax=Citrobacter sp. TaxID=1896336 RepID=UPI002FC79133
MEKMKRIALLAGMLATTLFFSIGASLASDGSRKANPPKDDSRGHFGFLSRPAAPIPPHYFRINVATDFSLIGVNGEVHSAGVNVYWKTTGSDQERGRTRVSPIAANLPNCPFSQNSVCGVTKARSGNPDISHLRMSSEHLEGLVWAFYPGSTNEYSGEPNPFHDDVCYPEGDDRIFTVDGIRTRFFQGFYKGYKKCGNGIADWPGIKYDSEGNFISAERDPNVQLSAMFNTQSSNICNNAGPLYCGGTGIKPNGDIYIPSNNLEYLVIEVIAFKTHAGSGDYFYTYPIVALKYTRVNPGNPNDYRMVFHHSGLSPRPASMDGFFGKGFSSWKNLNISASNLHFTMADPNEKVEYEVGTAGYTILDFENIDYLGLNLKFTGRFSGYHGSENVGVEINKYNLKCPLDSIECLYPTRY